MPYYQKLGEMPRKHHIWFHRNGATPTFKNEGIAYEHVITTEGFTKASLTSTSLRRKVLTKPTQSCIICVRPRACAASSC